MATIINPNTTLIIFSVDTSGSMWYSSRLFIASLFGPPMLKDAIDTIAASITKLKAKNENDDLITIIRFDESSITFMPIKPIANCTEEDIKRLNTLKPGPWKGYTDIYDNILYCWEKAVTVHNKYGVDNINITYFTDGKDNKTTNKENIQKMKNLFANRGLNIQMTILTFNSPNAIAPDFFEGLVDSPEDFYRFSQKKFTNADDSSSDVACNILLQTTEIKGIQKKVEEEYIKSEAVKLEDTEEKNIKDAVERKKKGNIKLPKLPKLPIAQMPKPDFSTYFNGK